MPKRNENLLRSRLKSSVRCIMHFGNASPDMNYGMDQLPNTADEGAYFRARQKKCRFILRILRFKEAEDYNLSGCFTSSATKCFLFAKSLKQGSAPNTKSKRRRAPTVPFLTCICARTAALKSKPYHPAVHASTI